MKMVCLLDSNKYSRKKNRSLFDDNDDKNRERDRKEKSNHPLTTCVDRFHDP